MKTQHQTIIIPGRENSIVVDFVNRAVVGVENSKLPTIKFPTYSRDDLLNLYKTRKSSRKNLQIWIFLTYDCNFNCTYCIQQKSKCWDIPSSISKHPFLPSNINLLIQFIKRQIRDETESLEVVFFGGEPLLEINTIKQIIYDLTRSISISKSFSIITNGALWPCITDDQLLQVKNIQITIDGTREIHDIRRTSPSYRSTYETIINKLSWIIKNMPDTEIQIRINVDKENKQFIPDFLRSEPILHHSGVTLDIARTKPNDSPHDLAILSEREFSYFFAEILDVALSEKIVVIPPNMGTCSLCIENTYYISPDNLIYRCPQLVGYKEHAIGTLSTVKDFGDNGCYPVDDTCITCSLFYYCFGRCKFDFIVGNTNRLRACPAVYRERNITNYYSYKYNAYLQGG